MTASRKAFLLKRLTPAGVALFYVFFAALWIAVSGYLLTSTIADPRMWGRIELTKGLVFVAVTGVLLFLLLKARGTAEVPETGASPVGMRLVLIFVALALVVPLIGFAITRLYAPQVEREAYADLEAIARLKGEQIENWLGERQGDSEVLARDARLAELAGRFMLQQDAELAESILDRFDQLRSSYNYDRIMLLDTRGRLLLTSGGEVGIAPVLPSLVQQALDSRRVQRRDIYRDDQGHIHLEWAVPLVVPDARGGRALSVIVLRITAQRFIFPLIQTWPTASASGETLLVRREGDSVVYLNELRHREDTALRLKIPASALERTAAIAVRSDKPGTVQGTDYRDVPVLAAHRSVAGTDWHIVAKVDRAEVMAPLRDLVLWVSLIALAAIAAISAAVLMLWRQQQRAHRVEIRERSMAAIEQSERHFHSLFENMLEGYVHCRMLYREGVPEDFIYLEVNPAFEKLSGLKDVVGKRATEVIPGMRESNPELFERYGRVAQSGQPERFEMYLDMLKRWFEVTVYSPEPGHFVAIFDNVTERKLSEKKILELNRDFVTLLESTSDFIYFKDENSRFRFCSQTLANITGHASWRDMVGKHDLEVFPEETARIYYEEELPIFREGKPLLNKTDPYYDEQGRQRWVNTNKWPVFGEDKKTVIGIFGISRDITEFKQAEQVLAESEQRFRSLVEQSLAGIYIVQDGKFAYVNPRLAEIFGYAAPQELIGVEPSRLVAEQDRELVAENMRKRLNGEVQDISYGFTAVRKDGSLIEVGVHGARATHQGRPAVIGLLQDVSEKKRAEDQIRHYLKQLENAFMRTVEMATTMSEMRDPYTAGHEKRVAQIAVAIGAEMGFDAFRLEGLRVGGHLHDIGKITIPAEILSKPGRLSPAEFELIKGHPQAGYDVLKNVGFPWPVADIAHQHHERMDGSGYPRGLKGEEILLEARIVAVADTVEAMSSHRPYRPGVGLDDALAEIVRGSGSHYDPEVVEACLRLFREKGYELPRQGR